MRSVVVLGIGAWVDRRERKRKSKFPRAHPKPAGRFSISRAGKELGGWCAGGGTRTSGGDDV